MRVGGCRQARRSKGSMGEVKMGVDGKDMLGNVPTGHGRIDRALGYHVLEDVDIIDRTSESRHKLPNRRRNARRNGRDVGPRSRAIGLSCPALHREDKVIGLGSER